MEVRSLSATAIKDFLQCQLKLVFRYDRDVQSVKNDHARLGIAVHEALDQFTRRMSSRKTFPDRSDYDFATKVFMDKAAAEGLESITFYKQGREIVHNYVNRYSPAEEVLDVEHRFKLETPEGVRIAGAIDKVVKLDDDTLLIVDYKTAKVALTPYELADDIQLSMYDLAASMIWPEFKHIQLCLDYVRIDKRVTTQRTSEDRQAFREFLESIWKQINSLPDGEIKGKVNKFCGWCDYKDRCPQYADLLEKRDTPLALLADMSDEDFIQHWEQMSALSSIVEGRQRELKVIAHCKFMEGAEIKGGGKELYTVQQSRTSYDLDQVVNLVPREDLLGLLTINKSRLDEYAREDAALRTKLNRIAQVSYNSPSYKVRTAKDVAENVEAEEYGFDSEPDERTT